jgi:rifampicin phosphotransferase
MNEQNLKIILDKNISNQNLGGKANNLLKLVALEINVPSFIIIPFNVLESLISKTNNIEQEIKNIEDCIFPENIIQEIENYLGNHWFAVRSSGGDEDGTAHSFAGQYETKLFVNKNNLAKAIKEVWLSAYNKRVIDYRIANNLALNNSINIIVQVMVNSKSSGVAFGVNPITGNQNEIVINNVLGLGEGLVNGDINADQYIVNKNNIEKTIVLKTEKYVQSKNGGVEKIHIETELQNISSLSDAQIFIIQKQLLFLNSTLNHPQDIEYAFDDSDTFYLLQTRPITTAFGKVLTVFDNSNIIESYPGLTSPLTYSFIIKMYDNVYTQLSHIIGIKPQKIKDYAHVYANMLAHIKGRVYYNLNNWYMSLALLPGYNLNAGFMESMMGVKEKFEIEPPKVDNKFQQWLDVLYALRKIIGTHNNIKKERTSFQNHFNAVMQKYEGINFDEKSLEELVDLYKEYEHTLVTKWNAPLINDFFAMVYFGLLQKQIKKYKLDKGNTLHNELLAGSGDIISTEPANLCLHITENIDEDASAKEIFSTKTDEQIWQLMQNGAMPNIKKQFDNYLYKWGARCVGELKLETITYNQQPWILVRIIKNYLLQNKNTKSFNANNALSVRKNAEEIIAKNLKGIKKYIFNYILNKARDLVSNRENLRYERTKGFAMVRNIFIAIDKKMLAQHYLQNERDIFWLQQDEVFEIIKTKNATNYFKIIEERKLQFQNWEKEILPERLNTYTDVHKHYFTAPSPQTLDGDLHGLPCCVGIVEARVCVLESPLDINDLQGDILVTSSTDPGWVTLFPTASAILVERGSLLSHSAIVSREMGIPCIVGISGLLHKLKTGDIVRMNGSTGEIKLINND